LILVVFSATVGYAFAESATVYGDDGSFYAAYNLQTGALRLISSPEDYNPRSEGYISWSSQSNSGNTGNSIASLADTPVGTLYSCSPSAPFAFTARIQSGWDSNAQAPLFTDVPVQITTFSAELVAKHDFAQFNQDPTIGLLTEGVYVYRPFESLLTIRGLVDPKYAGRNIQICYATLLDPQVIWTGSFTIQTDGSFEVTQTTYWNTPETIWFSGISMASMY